MKLGDSHTLLVDMCDPMGPAFNKDVVFALSFSSFIFHVPTCKALSDNS